MTRIALLVAVVAGAATTGCAATTTKTVTAPAGSSAAASASSTAPPQQAQVFHGSGQQALGTIVVPSDSTISWSCPSCGGTNFIINNAKSDDQSISTNALDQTHGVDRISAGTYHTVVVDTTGGPWTVAIGTAAPTPDAASAPPADSQAQPGYAQCDANISRSAGTDCQFAENAFYDYWAAHGASTISVYSPADGTSYTAHCSSSAGQVDCSTDQGGDVRFSQASVDSYTSDQAASYAASHRVR